jgi:hypothetical protein
MPLLFIASLSFYSKDVVSIATNEECQALYSTVLMIKRRARGLWRLYQPGIQIDR